MNIYLIFIYKVKITSFISIFPRPLNFVVDYNAKYIS